MFSLHPDNPHYFRFRGEATVLVTSAEHYGAVLNADFDGDTYLATLAADGLNHTRIFTGAYCEPEGAFGIARNTLAPAAGRLLCPWARSDTPGYAHGGARFDLSRWDEAYFARLRRFVERAGALGIVVEVNLFCPFYKDEMWALSPMRAANNVNGIGHTARDGVYRTDGEAALLAVQEAMVRRVAAELRDCDNVYYEVMNEPYIGAVPMAWQARIVDVLRHAEGSGEGHLVSLNIANRQADAAHLAEGPLPAGVQLLNFHYAWPPATVATNYALGCALGDNETGFAGTADFAYRREGWAFLLAGGALFNHLDYSFAVGCEDGTFVPPATQPGGGGPALRAAVGALARFVRGLDLVRMAPLAAGQVRGLADGIGAWGLRGSPDEVALYLCRTGDMAAVEAAGTAPTALSLDLDAGDYDAQWLRPVDTAVVQRQRLRHVGGPCRLSTPPLGQDLALRLRRREGGG